jgi:hypothetical protein
MPQITNLTTQALDFVVKGEPKDGVPPTESVQPGETRNVDLLDEQAGDVVGRVVGGAIRIGQAKQARHKE